MDFTFSWKILKYWINRESINNLILNSRLFFKYLLKKKYYKYNNFCKRIRNEK